MIDVVNDKIGTKYGCKYTYTAGAVGTFSDLNSTVTDGRKIKDPLYFLGSNFEAIDCPDPLMLDIKSTIRMLTNRDYETIASALQTGTEEATLEKVDFTKYKSVIDFTSIGTVNITAIPKDQILKTKSLMKISDYSGGINTLKIAVTNLFCKVALTVDNKSWYTYDATNKKWLGVDFTHATAVLKTEMMDYTTLNAFTATNFSAQFPNATDIGIALLIGIDGTDTTKSYSVDSIVLDYVGTDDSSPYIQYFNFIHNGFTKDGDAILIADRTIEQSITYTTLYNAKVVDGRTKVSVTKSEIGNEMYLRLPLSTTSKSSTDCEWDQLIVNATSAVLGTKTIEEVYNTEIPSYTNTIACETDTAGTAPGTLADVICRGGTLARYFTNAPVGTASANYGWRPILIVDLHSPMNEKPSAVLPVVTSTKDLAKGKCISCDYVYSSTGIGTFKNLGKAKYGLLTDYKNTANGSFYFICVGFDRKGNAILVADRPVATGLNYSVLATGVSGLTPGFSGSETSGASVTVDTAIHKLRLLNDKVDKVPTETGEYEAVINNSYDTTKTTDQIFHTNKTVCWTNTISAEKDSYMIIKGDTDAVKTGNNQRHLLYNTTNATILSNVGFRPVLTILPQTHIDSIEVTPYVGYEKQTDAANYKCDITVLDADNNLLEYKLVNGDDNTVIYSDFAVDISRTISVEKVTADKVTNISVVIKQTVNKVTTEKVLTTFPVFRDKAYRTTTTRTFGDIYGGWGATENVDYHTTNPKANPSAVIPTTVSDTHAGTTYVQVSKFASKVTFG